MRHARMVRTAAIVSAVAGHDWLVWRARTMMHNDAKPRGCRPAEPRAQPRSNLYSQLNDTCISTSRELFTNIFFSFRHPLRSCLSNAPTTLQQRWRVQPDTILRRHPPICDTLTHMGTGGGHLQGHDRGEWSEQDWF